jgi:hypothetical protein
MALDHFDPDNILQQLEQLYAFYVGTMKFTPETGVTAQYKIDVIVTTTWNNTGLNAWATAGSADNKVGVINVAPGAAQPGSWGLAHELGHVFQNFTFLGRAGVGLTDPSAGTFWETSAEYMAMQVYPDGGAGDLTRFLRTENLAYSSSRHHYGAWMLAQYIVDKHGGLPMFNRIWDDAKPGEHPLEVYRRLAGLTQDQLNTQLGSTPSTRSHTTTATPRTSCRSSATCTAAASSTRTTASRSTRSATTTPSPTTLPRPTTATTRSGWSRPPTASWSNCTSRATSTARPAPAGAKVSSR